MIKKLIQWLEDLETRKYRGCHLCKHLGEPLEAKSIYGSDDLVLSPCLACDKKHCCFQLDPIKVDEELGFRSMTKRQAREIERRCFNEV